jgi:hypothetical protein
MSPIAENEEHCNRNGNWSMNQKFTENTIKPASHRTWIKFKPVLIRKSLSWEYRVKTNVK